MAADKTKPSWGGSTGFHPVPPLLLYAALGTARPWRQMSAEHLSLDDGCVWVTASLCPTPAGCPHTGVTLAILPRLMGILRRTVQPTQPCTPPRRARAQRGKDPVVLQPQLSQCDSSQGFVSELFLLSPSEPNDFF